MGITPETPDPDPIPAPNGARIREFFRVQVGELGRFNIGDRAGTVFHIPRPDPRPDCRPDLGPDFYIY